ncbi:hypothetical protein CSA56_13765 [candidate division KSB3 bacterium]|uniref:Uncharacterized protein n=1 Tax=candidate division KSB3 bacterium TaxID=2044937 RepID=A0A2G6KB60_9BACT|nr:MAG: hypothetical protein CSA56_13765 [candidate division KSB3 bacterium]
MFLGMRTMFREKTTDMLKFELRELENVFGLLVIGSMIGIPSPPPGISMRLLPHMLREISVMTTRARDLDDVFGEVVGMMDI